MHDHASSQYLPVYDVYIGVASLPFERVKPLLLEKVHSRVVLVPIYHLIVRDHETAHRSAQTE